MKTILGGVGYVVFLVVVLAVLGFGLHHLDSVLTVTSKIAGIAFGLALLCLLLAIIPAARSFAGGTMVVLSYGLGLNVWLTGVYVVYTMWGLGALIGGLLFFGIGPVPMGIVALLFHHAASDAGWLFLGLVVMLTVRIGGAAIATVGDRWREKRKLEKQIIAEWRDKNPHRADDLA